MAITWTTPLVLLLTIKPLLADRICWCRSCDHICKTGTWCTLQPHDITSAPVPNFQPLTDLFPGCVRNWTPHLSEDTPPPLSAASHFLSPSEFSVTPPSLSIFKPNQFPRSLDNTFTVSLDHISFFLFLCNGQNFLISKAGFPRNVSNVSRFPLSLLILGSVSNFSAMVPSRWTWAQKSPYSKILKSLRIKRDEY